MTSCSLWRDCGTIDGGCCERRGSISFGTCAHCPDNDAGRWWLAFRRKLQIGSKIERVTRAVGIKPCGGCKRRRDYLNGDPRPNGVQSPRRPVS